ncbi:unnamed protein product, partial [Ixodes persulcatus]
FFNCTVCTAETPSAEAARAHANGTLSGRSRAAFPVLCVLTYISYAVLQTQKKSGSAIYGRIDCDTFVTKSMTPKQKRKGS